MLQVDCDPQTPDQAPLAGSQDGAHVETTITMGTWMQCTSLSTSKNN